MMTEKYRQHDLYTPNLHRLTVDTLNSYSNRVDNILWKIHTKCEFDVFESVKIMFTTSFGVSSHDFIPYVNNQAITNWTLKYCRPYQTLSGELRTNTPAPLPYTDFKPTTKSRSFLIRLYFYVYYVMHWFRWIYFIR